MVGEARTVVRGTDIVTFPVTVIDVQRSADGPGRHPDPGARRPGPLIDQTGGVAEGMSGSPVYVTGADGVARVIGAVAYGSGRPGQRDRRRHADRADDRLRLPASAPTRRPPSAAAAPARAP